MRNFRDAKGMAQSLREALGTRQITLTRSETLELVSRMLGVADWNTLSALINADRGEPVRVKPLGEAKAIFPAFPIKDMVPFPTMSCRCGSNAQRRCKP